jgi:hypothetical protein
VKPVCVEDAVSMNPPEKVVSPENVLLLAKSVELAAVTVMEPPAVNV